jgi:serine/threonine protein kinase
MTPALAPGSQLGPYRIEGTIGRGGMGVVYRASDTRLNRPVAIKVLSVGFGDEAARRRFQREAQTVSSLNHPHILTVYDIGDFDGQQYLVTEFVDGGTVRTWLRERPTSRQIVDLLVGVADGLAAAHQAKILHRDIKPENILVARNGYAKLGDFGLAKPSEDTTDLTQTLTEAGTRPGVIVGTIPYMSPEQATGKPIDARSDIFSFGTLLCEALTGQRPFQGATDLHVMQAIIHQDTPSLSPDLTPALRSIIEKALEKDPSDRYQTMRDMVVDLRRSPRLSAPSQPKLSRLPAPWWIAALAVALVAGIVVGRFTVRSGESGWSNPLEGATYTRLTDFSGSEEDAVISPDGTFVSFLSNRDGHTDVWLLQIASGQFLNLTKGKVDVFNTTIRVLGFTPDGSQVTIMQAPPRTAAIGTTIVPTIGGIPRRLLEGGLDPSWSADGKRLLFFSLVENKDPMFIADTNGANPKQLFPVKAGEHNHFMAWSPKWAIRLLGA